MSNDYTEFSFETVAKFFQEYPTGTMVSYLENRVELEVKFLRLPEADNADFYILAVPSTDNVFGECCMLPFAPTKWPKVDWYFIKPNGKQVNIMKKITYVERK